MTEAFLGLGSNIGDREKNIVHALLQLGKRLKIIDYSSLYNTSPFGYQDQGDFLNMVVKSDTAMLTPFELLTFVKDIEQDMGRKETHRWGPRLIDVDILYIEGVYIDSDALTIPHRELWNRNFVLIPLSELTEWLFIREKKFIIKERIIKDQTEQVMLYKSKEEILFNV